MKPLPILIALVIALLLALNLIVLFDRIKRSPTSDPSGHELTTPETEPIESVEPPPISLLEQSLIDAGLIDVQTLAADVSVRLAYATPDNFTGRVLYDSLERAYLVPEVARMVATAQEQLAVEKPGWQLIIFDAARPQQVQELMWEEVKGTDRQIYVANPAGGGSLHSYGASVDVGLADETGEAVDMGTRFDHFGPLAQGRYEQRFLESGELLPEQVANRRLLKRIMRGAGFRAIATEWWHFNAFSKEETRRRFNRLN